MASPLPIRVTAFFVLVSLAQADVSGQASVTVDASGTASVTVTNSLLQRKSVRTFVTAEEAEEPIHAHLVCHSEGCAEVQAKLAVLANRTMAAKAALEDCSKHRQKLSQDLDQASVARGKAEADLATCAEERGMLSANLTQCGKDRAEAEASLAECASERATLEADLKQCAEVDRPAAEAALAKCGEERAKLEKELEELAEKAKSSRRRRRKKSLAQTDAEVHEADVAAHEAETAADEAQETRVFQRLTELAQVAGDLEKRLEVLDNKIVEVAGALGKTEQKADKALQKIEKIHEREEQVLKEVDAMTESLTKAEELLTESDAMIKEVHNDLAISEQSMEAAATDVITEATSAAAAVTTLLQLNLEVHELREQEATRAMGERRDAIAGLKKKLEAQLAAGEGPETCDETRAQLIKDEATLAVEQGKLDECLAAKAVISQKLDAVEQAREKAEKGLTECLETKKKLQASLDECISRKEEAKKKLQECLSRKKELKEKIDACKTAKEEAKKKLDECLKRKDELKDKIKAMGGKSLVEGGPSQAASLIASGHVNAAQAFSEMLNELREHIRQNGEILEELAISEHAETEMLQDVIRENGRESGAEKAAAKSLLAGAESEKEAKLKSAKLQEAISEVGDYIHEVGVRQAEAKFVGERSPK